MPIIESVMGIQVIGNNGENIIKSPIVEAYIGSSLLDSTEVASDAPTDISTKVEQLMAAKHSHSNKSVLDKFAESKDGKPTYDGEALGGGGSTGTEFFVVNVQVQGGAEYTITSHDKTYTQIDEAYKAGKQILAVCTITGEDTVFLIPLILATETDYEFSIFAGANIYIYADSTDTWDISIDYLEASTIKAKISADASAQSQSLQYILNYMVYPAVEKAHEHDNKSILDLISAVDGKLRYNGSDVGLKGDKGDKGDKGAKGADGKTPVKGTDYWTSADKAEIVNDTLAAMPKWTGGSY